MLVTRSGGRAFAGIMFATGSRTMNVRPSVKLIIPTATATAPAVANPSSNASHYFLNVPVRYVQPKLVNVRFVRES